VLSFSIRGEGEWFLGDFVPPLQGDFINEGVSVAIFVGFVVATELLK
jgi:hypothetical protein